jgi:hypothetical protein
LRYTHPDPEKPPAPTWVGAGDSIIIQMDKGKDCFATFDLDFSLTGDPENEEDWYHITSITTTDSYTFSIPYPEETTYYFRYRIVDIFGKTSEFSDVTEVYVDATPNASYQLIIPRSTNHTVAWTDMGTFQNATSALTFTLPNNSDDPITVGKRVDILRYGSGAVDIVGDTGVTVRDASSNTLRVQYSMCSALKIGTNEWVLVGDMT